MSLKSSPFDYNQLKVSFFHILITTVVLTFESDSKENVLMKHFHETKFNLSTPQKYSLSLNL